VIARLDTVQHPADNVRCSSTPAAALQTCLAGTPARSLSLAGMNPSHYANAARVGVNLIARLSACDPR